MIGVEFVKRVIIKSDIEWIYCDVYCLRELIRRGWVLIMYVFKIFKICFFLKKFKVDRELSLVDCIIMII